MQLVPYSEPEEVFKTPVLLDLQVFSGSRWISLQKVSHICAITSEAAIEFPILLGCGGLIH